MKSLYTLILTFILTNISAQNLSENEKVQKACLNYIEGFYEGDTSKIIKALKPSLHKIGYWKNTNGIYQFDGQMSYRHCIDYARNVLQKRNFAKPSDPKKVFVLDITDHIAAAKVIAGW